MNKNLIVIFLTLFLLNYFQLYSQTTDDDGFSTSFILKGVVKLNGKPTQGVSLKLTKDGKEISKIITQKNGKYSFKMDESTTDAINEYLINISKEGTVPKILNINTYIPIEQYNDVPYIFKLEINLIETSVSGVALNFNSGKIKWVPAENKFDIDQEFQKTVPKVEEMATNSGKLTELADQKKKEKENLRADSLVKAKDDVEIRRVSELKKEQEDTKKLKQNIQLVGIKQPTKYHTGSLPNTHITPIIFPKEKQPVKNTPISITLVEEPEFDGAAIYYLNSQKSKQKLIQKKIEQKQSANYALKYETSNELTSLLDVIDESDKKEKNNK